MKKFIALAVALVMLLSVLTVNITAYTSYRSAVKNLSTLTDGVLVYYQGFDMANHPYPENATDLSVGNQALMDLLKWKVNNMSDGGLFDNTAKYSIVDGRLFVETDSTGGDSYCYILEDKDMWEVVGYGKYTIQYDIEYVFDGTNAKDRYIAILYNYDGYNTYNSFHLRTRGNANNQPRVAGSWLQYDDSANNPDNYAASAVPDKTIISKITNGEVQYASNTCALVTEENVSGLKLTVRIECDENRHGPILSIKNNSRENSDFVVVGTDSEMSTGASSWFNEATIPGFAIAMKPTKNCKAYFDNIYVYTGFGAPPASTNVTYTPLAFPAKEAIRNASSKELGGVVHVGTQEKVDNGKLAVRLIGGIESRKYDEAGFKVKITSGGTTTEKIIKTTDSYNRIYHTDAENKYSYYFSESAAYLFTGVIDELPATGDITIETTPYSVDFEGKTTEADTIVITYKDGAFVKQTYKQ